MCQRGQRTGVHWLDLRNMEIGMYAHVGREFKFNWHRTDDDLDLIWRGVGLQKSDLRRMPASHTFCPGTYLGAGVWGIYPYNEWFRGIGVDQNGCRGELLFWFKEGCFGFWGPDE